VLTKSYLLQQLETMENAKRVNREREAFTVINNPELFTFLIELFFDTNNKLSIKAAWTLEIVCEQQLDLLIPYLDIFTTNICNLKFDSAVRPAAKICNFLAIAYASKNNLQIQQKLTKSHIDCIVETGFDWLISNHKVATKAYIMNALYLFGKKYDWVHEELKLILLQNISNESAAYKARGRMTLDLINKK
jgi:hypothetical protein